MELERDVQGSMEICDGYARLLWWEVTNFMAIEHGRCEFDERNIINFKGYNDSGKSAMLRGLSVLLYNAHPTQQTKFIMDDREYFRVLAKFEDGVMILRDKYINGQSLYEMYLHDELIYTSKSESGVLTKITEVPKPIADYLGLVMFDDMCLNSRACFEKQIGVETSGSENYNLFHTVLKAEELARASILLNTDKNSLIADIASTDAQLQSNKELLGRDKDLTVGMIEYLCSHDAVLDRLLMQEGELREAVWYLGLASGVQIPPELGMLDTDRVNLISTVFGGMQELGRLPLYPVLGAVGYERVRDLHEIRDGFNAVGSIEIVPELHILESGRLCLLREVVEVLGLLGSHGVQPELRGIDVVQLEMALRILDLQRSVRLQDEVVGEIDDGVLGLQVDLERLEAEAKSMGRDVLRCPSCGVLFYADDMHCHDRE